MMRVTEQEMLGAEFGSLWPADIRPEVDDAVATVLAGAQSTFDAYRLADDKTTWWSVILAPVIDSEGSVAKFISIATDITFRRKAEEERAAFYEQRIRMEKRHAREKEQLLMDLHDGVGGIAVNISMIAAMARRAGDPGSMEQALASIFQLAHDEITEVRSFMTSLDPTELNWRSLAAELNHRGSTMLEPHHIAFTFNASIEEVDHLPGSFLWVTIAKICREALTNVVKHAKAGAVTIDLSVGPRELRLAIRDNGVGWPVQNVPGRGIANIRRRAAVIGGKVALSGDKGMQIVLTVPMPFEIAVPA